MSEGKTPVLDRPGAGLPFPENFLARYVLFPMSYRRRGRDGSIALFERETDRILKIATEMPRESFHSRILIDRFPGIEDSSRFWSTSMTLGHLLITMRGMSGIIASLSQGVIPPVEVRTELVKPKVVDAEPSETLEAFRTGAREALEIMRACRVDTPGLRVSHPWFGPMSAFQWIWLLGQHQAIHRKQIEKIRGGIR